MTTTDRPTPDPETSAEPAVAVPPTPCLCGAVHDPGKVYFVSCLRGERTALLLGPYDTHAQALSRVDRGRALANRVDPWTAFDSFGTCGVDGPTEIVGKLNDMQDEGPPARGKKRVSAYHHGASR